MKTQQAKILLNKTIRELGDTLADLVFEANILVHTYKTVRSGESIAFDPKRRVYTHHAIGDWWSSISADDLREKRGNCRFYIGAAKGDKQSITKRFPATLNSQFRWLLVAAYEAYERYLLRTYAEIGYCDRNLWRCADFGNRYHIKDTTTLGLDAFLTRMRESSEFQPEKVRNRFGSLFPRVQAAEDSNSIKFADEVITCRDYIDLIATLRHVIVHEQSRIEPEEFFHRIRQRWKRKQDLSPRLQSLILLNEFQQSQDGWEIWLVEKSPLFQESCSLMDGPLRCLIERLGTHACLIYAECIEHFGHKPFWKEQGARTNA